MTSEHIAPQAAVDLLCAQWQAQHVIDLTVASSSPSGEAGKATVTFEQTVSHSWVDGSTARPVSRSIGLAPRVRPRPAHPTHDTSRGVRPGSVSSSAS